MKNKTRFLIFVALQFVVVYCCNPVFAAGPACPTKNAIITLESGGLSYTSSAGTKILRPLELIDINSFFSKKVLQENYSLTISTDNFDNGGIGCGFVLLLESYSDAAKIRDLIKSIVIDNYDQILQFKITKCTSEYCTIKFATDRLYIN